MAQTPEEMLNETFKKYSVEVIDQWLNYDEEAKTWNIAGHDTNNNYFETDDYEAESLEDAQMAAIDYLETYNEEA